MFRLPPAVTKLRSTTTPASLLPLPEPPVPMMVRSPPAVTPLRSRTPSTPASEPVPPLPCRVTLPAPERTALTVRLPALEMNTSPVTVVTPASVRALALLRVIAPVFVAVNEPIVLVGDANAKLPLPSPPSCTFLTAIVPAVCVAPPSTVHWPPSRPTLLNYWVEAVELDAGIGGRELPLDLDLPLIPLQSPGLDFLTQSFHRFDPLVQALSR